MYTCKASVEYPIISIYAIEIANRHYPLAVIEYGIEKAKDIDITTLRTPNEHIDTDIITFDTTHNPYNVNMFILYKSIRKY